MTPAPSTKTTRQRSAKTTPTRTRRDWQHEVRDLERRVIKRLNSAPPASFEDLIEEGLLTEGQANTMRGRLRGRLVQVGTRSARGGGGGRPHVLYNVRPK